MQRIVVIISVHAIKMLRSFTLKMNRWCAFIQLVRQLLFNSIGCTYILLNLDNQKVWVSIGPFLGNILSSLSQRRFVLTHPDKNNRIFA